MFRFEELDIWNLSLEFCLDLYKTIDHFPKLERFSLSDQLRRAAISIPTNIAEGSGTNTTKDFIRFLGYSIGSTAETVSLITLAHKLDYIDSETKNELYEKAEKIIRKTRRFKQVIK